MFETIETTKSLGLKYLELFPGQKLSKEHPVNTDQTLTPDLRDALKRKLADAGVRAVNIGVVPLGKDDAADRRLFEFAKEFGIETLVAEPPPESLERLDKLCEQYGINIAIHDHPKPARYWNPDAVLEATKGRSGRIGACADVGHWTRSGLDTVESLKKLQGHIVSFHFKDVNAQKQDVPWGTGRSNVEGMLEEMHRQDFKGVFSIEYERGSGQQLLDDLRQSIAVFDRDAAELSRP